VSETLAAMTDDDALRALAALAQPSRLQVFRAGESAGFLRDLTAFQHRHIRSRN